MKKIIHYCWFGGKELPKKVKKCIATWKKYLPDYEIKEWNETNFDLNTSNFARKAYDNKKWAFVSDYVRIFAIYNQGGIYLDTDMKILKDPKDIIEKPVFFGYEDSGYVGTAIMGASEKHNEFFKKILDYYDNIEDFNPDIIYNYANPVIISKFLEKYDSIVDENGITIANNSIYIYPRDYFYPLSYDYSEKVYTKNTCMVHLFNATWTSLKERRTMLINRKFGPQLGKVLNSIINGFVNVKNNIKKGIYKIYKFLRFRASIYITRGKRIRKIGKENNKITGNYVVISNPDNVILNDKIDGLFGDNVLYIRAQYTFKEADSIAKELSNSNRSLIIFSSYYKGWDMLIKQIKKYDPKVKINVLLDSNMSTILDSYNWINFEKVFELYKKHEINEIGFFDKQMYDFCKNQGIKCKILLPTFDVSKYNIQKKNDNGRLKIGIYETCNKPEKNVANMFCAASKFQNAEIYCGKVSYEISMFARFLKINLSSVSEDLETAEKLKKISEMDINLMVNLTADQVKLALQCLDIGSLALVGPNSYFEGTELEKYLVVKNPSDINEIFEKMEIALENKEKILDLFEKWKKDYLKNSMYKRDLFLEI